MKFQQRFLIMNNWIKRKKTKTIMVGNVPVGGDNPISIQSMTNTNTSDVVSTINQIKVLVNSKFSNWNNQGIKNHRYTACMVSSIFMMGKVIMKERN